MCAMLQHIMHAFAAAVIGCHACIPTAPPPLHASRVLEVLAGIPADGISTDTAWRVFVPCAAGRLLFPVGDADARLGAHALVTMPRRGGLMHGGFEAMYAQER